MAAHRVWMLHHARRALTAARHAARLFNSCLQAANAAKAHEATQSVSQRLSSWWRGEGATVTAVADAKGVVNGRGTGMGCSAHGLHEHGHRVSA